MTQGSESADHVEITVHRDAAGDNSAFAVSTASNSASPAAGNSTPSAPPAGVFRSLYRMFAGTPFLAGVFLYHMYLTSNWGYAQGSVFTLLTAGGLGLLFTMMAWDRRNEPAPVGDWVQMTALSCVAIAVGGSTLANLDGWRNAIVGWWLLLAFAVITTGVRDLLQRGRLTTNQFADGFLIAAVPVILTGMVQVLWFGGRARLPFDHPNYFGTVAVFAICLAGMSASDAIRGQSWTQAAPRVALLFFAICGLWLSGSRGAFVGLLAATLLLSRRLAVVCIVVGGPVLVAAIFSRWNSVIARLPVFQDAMDVFWASPLFGQGPMSFRYLQFGEVHLQAHALPLHTLAELGAVGGVLCCVALLATVWAVVSTESHRWTGWSMALVATTVHQLVDVTWLNPGVLAVLAVAWACVLHESGTADRLRPVLSGKTCMIAQIGWLVAAAAVVASAALLGPIPSEFFSLDGLVANAS